VTRDASGSPISRDRDPLSSGCREARAGYQPLVFFLFSNRLGCLGSLAVSIVVTAILLMIFWR
jgi:hypothetical protein